MNPEQNPLPPVAPVTQPMIPAPEPPKSNNKIVMALVAIVILLLVIVGALVFAITQMKKNETFEVAPSPTPQVATEESSPTSEAVEESKMGWETYTNQGYDFSLQYPTDWEIRDLLPSNKEIPSHSNDLVFLGIAPANVKEDFAGSIVVKRGNVLEIEIDNAKNFPVGTPMRMISDTKASFAGHEATEIRVENTMASVTSKTIIFKDELYTYIITGGGSADNSTIDQILSTFEFTN